MHRRRGTGTMAADRSLRYRANVRGLRAPVCCGRPLGVGQHEADVVA